MVDVSPSIGFVAVTPCRIVDTRGGGVFTGAYGPPALVGNAAARPFDINSAAHCPGIPAGADAYSLNFTLIAAAGAFQNAFLTAWPTGGAQPVVSTLNFNAGQLVANAAIVPAGTNGSINVFVNAPGHLLIDINGYFADTLGSNQFEVRSGGGVAIYGENTGKGYGVWGISAGGFGVVAGGQAGGVWATTSGNGSGVYGQNTGGGYGVYGNALQFGDSGVYGQSATGFGVRGKSASGIGVQGEGDTYGVHGLVTTGANRGYLAAFGYGVYAVGDFGGTGAKHFVEPHPRRADLVIRYISLEGNESGTYFRGRGRFQNGLATIEVPEDFRLVTDSEGLSVVATPIGPMATVSVASIGLDRIVLRGSRNVEFFYLVNGVRKTHRHLTPIGEGREFMPETPVAKMPGYLTEGQKQMLISNGTYNADGTVNMETARRLGWDKEWEKRGRPAPQPAE